jgi:hypothetical protein
VDFRQNCGNQAITTKPNFSNSGVYAPIEGKEQETEEFYTELQVTDKIPKKENIIIAGDFNGRTDNQPISEGIGPNGEQVINHNGTALRDFSTFNKLKITNSFYRQKHTQIYVGSQRNEVNKRLHNHQRQIEEQH